MKTTKNTIWFLTLSCLITAGIITGCVLNNNKKTSTSLTETSVLTNSSPGTSTTSNGEPCLFESILNNFLKQNLKIGNRIEALNDKQNDWKTKIAAKLSPLIAELQIDFQTKFNDLLTEEKTHTTLDAPTLPLLAEELLTTKVKEEIVAYKALDKAIEAAFDYQFSPLLTGATLPQLETWLTKAIAKINAISQQQKVAEAKYKIGLDALPGFNVLKTKLLDLQTKTKVIIDKISAYETFLTTQQGLMDAKALELIKLIPDVAARTTDAVGIVYDQEAIQLSEQQLKTLKNVYNTEAATYDKELTKLIDELC